MADIQSLSRSELEEYTKQLEQEKEILLQIVDLAKEHIQSSTDTHREILENLEKVQQDTNPAPTHYNTTGVDGAIDELREIVNENTEHTSDSE
jgi:hypothetical protein